MPDFSFTLPLDGPNLVGVAVPPVSEPLESGFSGVLEMLTSPVAEAPPPLPGSFPLMGDKFVHAQPAHAKEMVLSRADVSCPLVPLPDLEQVSLPAIREVESEPAMTPPQTDEESRGTSADEQSAQAPEPPQQAVPVAPVTSAKVIPSGNALASPYFSGSVGISAQADSEAPVQMPSAPGAKVEEDDAQDPATEPVMVSTSPVPPPATARGEWMQPVAASAASATKSASLTEGRNMPEPREPATPDGSAPAQPSSPEAIAPEAPAGHRPDTSVTDPLPRADPAQPLSAEEGVRTETGRSESPEQRPRAEMPAPSHRLSPGNPHGTDHVRITDAADGSMRLSLGDDDIGRIEMKVHETSAGLRIDVTAERPESLDVARRQMQDIQRDLRLNGYGDVSFTFAGERGSQRSDRTPGTGPIEPPPDDGSSFFVAPGESPRAAPRTSGLDLRL